MAADFEGPSSFLLPPQSLGLNSGVRRLAKTMNLKTLADLSQLAAAIGVIVSLLFVAMQLRQGTKAVKASTIQNLIQSLSSNSQVWAENESLVAISLKASADENSLTELERARLYIAFVMATRRFEGVYYQRALNLVDIGLIQGFARANLSVIASKSGRIWWADAKEMFSPRFVAYVDHELSTSHHKALHPHLK